MSDDNKLRCESNSAFSLRKKQPAECTEISFRILSGANLLKSVYYGCYILDPQFPIPLTLKTGITLLQNFVTFGEFKILCKDSYGINCFEQCILENEKITCDNQGDLVCVNNSFLPPNCVKQCAPNLCKNDGTCKIYSLKTACECKKFTYGSGCEYFNCTAESCFNGGCINGICICHTNYHGVDCSHSSCETKNPCGDYGICNTDDSMDYRCKCHDGNFGSTCKKKNNALIDFNEISYLDVDKVFSLYWPPYNGSIDNRIVEEETNQPLKAKTASHDSATKNYQKNKSSKNKSSTKANSSYHGSTTQKHSTKNNKIHTNNSKTTTIKIKIISDNSSKSIPKRSLIEAENISAYLLPGDTSLESLECNNQGSYVLNSTSGNYQCKCFSQFYGNSCEFTCNYKCVNGYCAFIPSTNEGNCTCFEGYMGANCTEMTESKKLIKLNVITIALIPITLIFVIIAIVAGSIILLKFTDGNN